MHYILPHVICFRWVTWLVAMRTWLAQGAEYLIFLRTEKNRGIFHEFYARFFMNAHFKLWSARAFSQNRACVSLHSRPCPQCTIWIECSHWSIFEFLARDFPKTTCIARLILSSPPYYLHLLWGNYDETYDKIMMKLLWKLMFSAHERLFELRIRT